MNKQKIRKNLPTLKKEVFKAIEIAKRDSKLLNLIEGNDISSVVEDILVQMNQRSDDIIELEISLDLIRKFIWNLDESQEGFFPYEPETYLESFANLRTSLSELYKYVLENFPGELKSLPFNYWMYKKLLSDDKKFGYPILKRTIHCNNIPDPPEREPKFVERVEDIKEILDNITIKGKISYCISGSDPGDENAGVGKTTLAKEIANLCFHNTSLSEFDYLDDSLIRLVEIARKKYSDGIIWISLESNRKHINTYVQIISNIIGVDFNPVEESEEAYGFNINDITNLKRRIILINENPINIDELSKASDEKIIDILNKYLEKHQITEREMLNIFLEKNKISDKDFEAVITDKYFRTNNEDEAFPKTDSSHIFNQNIAEEELYNLFDETSEIAKAKKEDLERQKHNRIDCLEKVAILLKSKRILLVIDNAEQDRSTFEYLYLRLRHFVSMLITCRIQLPGIECFLLNPFNLPTAKRYLNKIRKSEKLSLINASDQTLEMLFKQIKFNPFCISLLSYNLKDSLEDICLQIENRLKLTPRDNTTVRRIIVCLEVTKALAIEEKEFLFDANLFFDQYFTAKELSYYYPNKNPEYVQQVIHNIYNDKRIIRIYEKEEDQETSYELQQGVIEYLDQWFIEEKLDCKEDLAEEELKEIIRKLDDSSIEQTKSSVKRLNKRIEQLRYSTYYKGKYDANYKIWWGGLIFDYFSYSVERKYFIQKAIIAKETNISYYEYWKASGDEFDDNIFSAQKKIANYQRIALKNLKRHGFYEGLISLQRHIHSRHSSFLQEDYLISEFQEKLSSSNLHNKLNIVEGLSLLWRNKYSKEEYLAKLETLNLEKKLYSWEFNYLFLKYSYLLYEDIEEAKKIKVQLLELIPDYFEDFKEEKIATVEIPHLLFVERYKEGENQFQIINNNAEFKRKGYVNEDKLLLWDIEIAIGLMDDKRIYEGFEALKKKVKKNRNIHYCIDLLRLQSLLELQKGNFSVATLKIEKTVQTILMLGLNYFPHEEHARRKIIKKIGKKEYEKIKSNKNIKVDYIKPNFLSLPSDYQDSQQRKMILIKEGRMVEYGEKTSLPLLLHIPYAISNLESFVSNDLKSGLFHSEEMLYPFYVDKNPVTKEEFEEFFSSDSLPVHERIEYPKFTAENVKRYAKAQDKLPMIEKEWIKLYTGVNYNLGYDTQDSDIMKSDYENLFSNTTYSKDQFDYISQNLALLEYSEDFIEVQEKSFNKTICTLLAYSLAIGTIPQKLNFLSTLTSQEVENRTIFNGLKKEIIDLEEINEDDDIFLENKELEMAWHSQKNIWAITLRYFLGIDKRVELITNRSKEAVIIEQDGLEGMYIKEASNNRIQSHQAANPDRFVPFRCVKMWYNVVE